MKITHSVKSLRVICQQGKMDKNFNQAIGYFLHRKISIYLTWLIINFFPNVRPNHVSVAMFFSSIIGVILLLEIHPILMIFGFVFIYFGFLLDKVDGELARYYDHHSLTGMYLDELYHLLVQPLMFGFFAFAEDPLILLLVVGFTLFHRAHRKIPLHISLKSRVRQNISNTPPKIPSLVCQAIKFLPIRASAVVERFDIWLFVFFTTSFTSFHSIIFLFYIVISSVYLFRRVVGYLCGDLHQEVKRINQCGY